MLKKSDFFLKPGLLKQYYYWATQDAWQLEHTCLFSDLNRVDMLWRGIQNAELRLQRKLKSSKNLECSPGTLNFKALAFCAFPHSHKADCLGSASTQLPSTMQLRIYLCS